MYFHVELLCTNGWRFASRTRSFNFTSATFWENESTCRTQHTKSRDGNHLIFYTFYFPAPGSMHFIQTGAPWRERMLSFFPAPHLVNLLLLVKGHLAGPHVHQQQQTSHDRKDLEEIVLSKVLVRVVGM